MNPAQEAIWCEYQMREDQAGGVANVDPQEIANDIADEWDIPVEDVNDAIRAAQCVGIGSG